MLARMPALNGSWAGCFPCTSSERSISCLILSNNPIPDYLPTKSTTPLGKRAAGRSRFFLFMLRRYPKYPLHKHEILLRSFGQPSVRKSLNAFWIYGGLICACEEVFKRNAKI